MMTTRRVAHITGHEETLNDRPQSDCGDSHCQGCLACSAHEVNAYAPLNGSQANLNASLTGAKSSSDKPVHIDAVASLTSDGSVTWTAYVYSAGSLDASATGSDRQAAVVDAVARYRAFKGAL